ncbi:MAG: hypothetical protein VYB61_05645 [Verrucomicrobiota bacterium]|nr:hypothetical protein [Verrucomicrobiota bacterium]
MNQKETGAAPLSSPFEIADHLPAKPEVDDAFSSQAVKQPVHLSSPEDAMNREGDAVTEGTNGRLFGEAPKLSNESPVAGFGETVMENEVGGLKENTEPFSAGASSTDQSSVNMDDPPKEDQGWLSSSVSDAPEPVVSLNELPWVDDPAQSPEESPSFSDLPTESSPGRDKTQQSNEVDDFETGSGGMPGGDVPFPHAASMTGLTEFGNEQALDELKGDDRSQGQQSYSSSIPEGPVQTAGGVPFEQDDPLPEFSSGDFAAGLDRRHGPEDEPPRHGKDFPVFEDSFSKQEGASGGLSDESQFTGKENDFSDVGFGDGPPLSGLKASEAPGVANQPFSVPDPDSLSTQGGGDLLKAHRLDAEPLESLSPLSADFASIPASPSEPQPKLEHEIPGIRADLRPSSIAGQPTLRALLMTDSEIDGQMIVAHCADLEGVHQCVACTADGRIKVSSMQRDCTEIDFLGLLGSVRAFTEAFGTGLEGPLTFRSPKGLVSFFASGDACLGVLHSEEALKAGVEERLRLIAGALNAECK